MFLHLRLVFCPLHCLCKYVYRVDQMKPQYLNRPVAEYLLLFIIINYNSNNLHLSPKVDICACHQFALARQHNALDKQGNVCHCVDQTALSVLARENDIYAHSRR